MHINDLFPKRKNSFSPFVKIWGLSVFGNLFIFFLAQHLHEIPQTVTFSLFTVLSLLFGLLAHFGIKLVDKAELNSLNSSNFFKTDLLPAISGTALSIIGIFILDRVFIKISPEEITFLDSSPFWARIISSFYDSINLEIVFRLFLLSLIYYLLKKFIKKKEMEKYLIWTSILIAALAPALNYLFADGATQSKLLISNTIGGAVYGYLFVYRSFWSGATAHFLVDFLLNGI